MRRCTVLQLLGPRSSKPTLRKAGASWELSVAALQAQKEDPQGFEEDSASTVSVRKSETERELEDGMNETILPVDFERVPGLVSECEVFLSRIVSYHRLE